MSCHFCYNAYVWSKEPLSDEDYFDGGLHDNNDGSSCSIGRAANGFSIMLNSGMGKPCEVEFRNLLNNEWHTVGFYYPKFCPECGRKLEEYIIDERGTSFKRLEVNND